MWIFEDSSGNHLTVVESLGSKAHLSQPTGIDELENLGRTNKPSDHNTLGGNKLKAG